MFRIFFKKTLEQGKWINFTKKFFFQFYNEIIFSGKFPFSNIYYIYMKSTITIVNTLMPSGYKAIVHCEKNSIFKSRFELCLTCFFIILTTRHSNFISNFYWMFCMEKSELQISLWSRNIYEFTLRKIMFLSVIYRGQVIPKVLYKMMKITSPNWDPCETPNIAELSVVLIWIMSCLPLQQLLYLL